MSCKQYTFSKANEGFAQQLQAFRVDQVGSLIGVLNLGISTSTLL